jgi:hypothetical protein
VNGSYVEVFRTKAAYRYAYVESGAARLLVVMDGSGVVDVIRGTSYSDLISSALLRHPEAGFLPDAGAHAEWVEAAVQGSDQS